MIQQERGITPKQYADDIVWPMLALRCLARGAVEPSAQELQEAFENRFGPAVKARIIACRTRQEAEAIRTQALTAPDEFGALARQHSVDVGSASANGWVQPVRHHSGDAGFEQAVFALQPGDIKIRGQLVARHNGVSTGCAVWRHDSKQVRRRRQASERRQPGQRRIVSQHRHD
jgi:hypothetical protein